MNKSMLKTFWVFLLPAIVFSQINNNERTVVKTEKTAHGEKTITEVLQRDMLIKRQVEERRTGDNPLKAKYTRFYQDGKEVLFEYWDSKSEETVRYFMQDSRLIMAELDHKSDGVFEWLIFFGKDEKVGNVFKRTRGGDIELLTGTRLEEFKEGSVIAKELFSR